MTRRLALTLLLALTLTCAGCRTGQTTVISSDRALVRMRAAQPFAPAHDGWFVPDALFKDWSEALADKAAK